MDTTRLETFSDGVFAIAITLLVLEIKVPPVEGALVAELLRLWPSYLAYVVSFVVIGAVWMNHHAMFRQIERADNAILLLNVLHLMLVAFLPFPTAVLAEAFHSTAGETTATAFYGATLTVTGIPVCAMWWHAVRGKDLLRADLAPAEATQMGRRFLVGPLVYALATFIALFVPWLSLLIYVALNLFFLWPSQNDASESK